MRSPRVPDTAGAEQPLTGSSWAIQESPVLSFQPGEMGTHLSTLPPPLRGRDHSPGPQDEGFGLPGQPYLFAASAARSKLALVAGDTVIILLVWDEGSRPDGLLAAAAYEAVLVPGLSVVLQLAGPCEKSRAQRGRRGHTCSHWTQEAVQDKRHVHTMAEANGATQMAGEESPGPAGSHEQREGCGNMPLAPAQAKAEKPVVTHS